MTKSKIEGDLNHQMIIGKSILSEISTKRGEYWSTAPGRMVVYAAMKNGVVGVIVEGVTANDDPEDCIGDDVCKFIPHNEIEIFEIEKE